MFNRAIALPLPLPLLPKNAAGFVCAFKEPTA